MDSNGHQYTEQDLNFLIEKHLEDCEELAHVCMLKQTPTGKQRIITRMKELFFTQGVTNVAAAMATIEAEIIAESEQN